MNPEKAIAKLVKDIVSSIKPKQKVYPMQAPEGASLPSVTYSNISYSYKKSLNNKFKEILPVSFNIAIWDDSAVDLYELIEYMPVTVMFYIGTHDEDNECTYHHIEIENINDMYDLSSETNKKYGKSLTMKAWLKNEIIINI